MYSTLFTKCTYSYRQPDPIYVTELANVIAMAWVGSTAIKRRMDRKSRSSQRNPDNFSQIRRLWNSEDVQPHFVEISCWSVGCYVVARCTMHRSHVVSSSGIWRYNSNNNNNNNNSNSNNIAGTVDRRKTKIE
jgi:hypothetical protein